MLAPYVHGGLVAGEKCACIVEVADRPALLAQVRRPGDVDVEGCLASGQLELFTSAESYLRRGSFSGDDMVDFWTTSLDGALGAGGYDAVRHAGDTVVVSEVVEVFDDFAIYESQLNLLVGRYPQTMLCLYDIRELGAGVLLEVLRTHPKLLMGGLVIDNPHYLPPDEYLASRRVRVWAALSDEERRVAELAVEGLRTTEMAAPRSSSSHDVDRALHGVFRKLGVESRDDLVRFVTERRRP